MLYTIDNIFFINNQPEVKVFLHIVTRLNNATAQ